MDCFYSAQIDERLSARWHEYIDRASWAHYMADDRWAETERCGSGLTARRPFFFWAEEGGEICLTAVGVRQQLPIPGRAFWEFKKGPTFIDRDLFGPWLDWLVPALGRDAARLRVGPPVPLDDGGDDIETVLERHGFVRRRTMGTWGTLCVDLTREEDDIFASFRRQTRQGIKKCAASAIAVAQEDNHEGWSTLCDLQTAMCARAPVPSICEETVARISKHWFDGGAGGTLLVARDTGGPRAAALVVVYRTTAYLRMLPSAARQNGSSGAPASHLLVWEAMRWARAAGCTMFDLEGFSLVAQPGDPLWGVNQFKRGFVPTEEPLRTVAIHERVSWSLIDTSARACRRVQSSLLRSRAEAAT